MTTVENHYPQCWAVNASHFFFLLSHTSPSSRFLVCRIGTRLWSCANELEALSRIGVKQGQNSTAGARRNATCWARRAKWHTGVKKSELCCVEIEKNLKRGNFRKFYEPLKNPGAFMEFHPSPGIVVYFSFFIEKCGLFWTRLDWSRKN